MMIDPNSIAEAATSVALNAAAAAGVAPTVKVGWTPTTTGIWTLVGLALVHLFRGISTSLPDLYAKWFARDGEVRAAKRLDKLSTAERLAAVEERMARYSGSLAFLANAVTSATQALDSEDHDERARAKATSLELVAMAVSTLGNDDPFTDALSRITRASAALHQDTPYRSGKPG